MSKELTDEDIRIQIKDQLTHNINKGYSEAYDVDYCTIQPSPGTYPYQYFWDSCFHVFILTALGEHELAKKVMQSLYGMQSDDGFVGHISYWDKIEPAKWTDAFQSRYKDLAHPHMSALVQPPLSAQALDRIWYHTKDKQLLNEMVPKLKKHFDWLADNRDFDGDGLITIITMFESGMDWKPTMDPVLDYQGKGGQELFDKAVSVDFYNFMDDYDLDKIKDSKRFLVKEVAFNTIYAQNLEALAKLCDLIGDADADKYAQLSHKVAKSIKDKMYDEEAAAFWDLQGPDDKPLKILTPTIFFPIVLPVTTEEMAKKIIDKHLFNDEEFGTEFPLPSVAKNEPSFDPEESDYIWRGPTWVMYNWFIYQCLFYKGFKDEAAQLRESIRSLIKQSGLREYYNPFTGEGYGAKHFTWSGVVVDMLNLK